MNTQLTKKQSNTIKQISSLSATYAKDPDKTLADRVMSLRYDFCLKPEAENKIRLQAIALANEALKRTLNIELYDVQLTAANELSKRSIVEMQTGEGKTFAAFPAAVFGALVGHGTHIATTNSYLAERDFRQLKPAFDCLGIRSGFLPSEVSTEKHQAYQNEVLFGPGFEFGFDYLRNQIARDSVIGAAKGEFTLGQFQEDFDSFCRLTEQVFSIVDEADHVLIDDAISPLVISTSTGRTAPDAEAVQLAHEMTMMLHEETDFVCSGSTLELTRSGMTLIHDESLEIPIDQLQRPWKTYVENALKAEKYFRRDEHYVIKDGKVNIIDRSTGRIYQDRTWQSGIHQAIEAKEKVTIRPSNNTQAKINRQAFFRCYTRLGGLSGTVMSCKDELQKVYDLNVVSIPLRTPSQRKLFPTRTFASADSKWHAITDSIRERHRVGQPVLIGTRTIQESETLAAVLSSSKLPFELLNGKQDREEAEIVKLAGQTGAITIATNLAGRGTDIKLDEKVKGLGGLHVIVSECHASQRVDRQLIGRSGRQGDPGSAQTFVSADDWLIAENADWLARSIKRLANRSGELDYDIDSKIRRIQQLIERTASNQRMKLR